MMYLETQEEYIRRDSRGVRFFTFLYVAERNTLLYAARCIYLHTLGHNILTPLEDEVNEKGHKWEYILQCILKCIFCVYWSVYVIFFCILNCILECIFFFCCTFECIIEVCIFCIIEVCIFV